MNAVVPTNPIARAVPISYMEPSKVKKWALIALSTIMALGMIFAYTFGAPWTIVLLFFALALAPLYPLSTIISDQRKRVLEKSAT